MGKKYSVSVILPTYNESMNIREMIKRLNKSVAGIKEIIVVDDDSPDDTAKFASGMQNTKVIIRKKERGVASAIHAGIKIAKGDVIAWMDCDLSMPPEVLGKMLEKMDGNDVVVGSRYAGSGRDKRDFIRVLTSRAINLMANIILNFKVRDYDSGFVAAKRKVFDKVSFNPKGHGEYCIEFLYKCTKKGMKVKEVGYIFEDRKRGTSKSNASVLGFLKFGFQYAGKIVKLRFSE